MEGGILQNKWTALLKKKKCQYHSKQTEGPSTYFRLEEARAVWQSDYKGGPGVFFVSKGHQLDSMANLDQSQQITYLLH